MSDGVSIFVISGFSCEWLYSITRWLLASLSGAYRNFKINLKTISTRSLTKWVVAIY